MSTQVQVTAHGDGEGALQQALAVTPSPDFVARVRHRLREQPVHSPTHGWLAAASAAAVVTAIILAAAHWSGGKLPERAAEANRTVPRTPAVASTDAPGAENAGVPSSISERPASRSNLARVVPPSLTLRLAPAREEPREVLVSEAERRTLDRFLIAMREGRALVPAPRRVLEDENGLLLEPRPIEIPLMRPIEPLPGTAADRLGSRDR